MGLNIKNEAAHVLATELAGLRGTSLTQAVTDALRNELEREKRRRSRIGLSEDLLMIGRQCAAHIREPITSENCTDFLYDEHGLPR